MKILRFISAGVVTVALLVAFHNLSSAQPPSAVQNQEPLDKFSNLVVTLTKRGDTNTVAQISDVISAMDKQKSATDASFYVRILTCMRTGKTNEAIELIETRLDGAIMSFSYEHEPKYDKLLLRAKEYRTTYPHTSSEPEINAAVARAFDFLPKKVD